MSPEAEAISAEVIINNARGLHARASAQFVTCARGYDARVEIAANGQSVSADSIMEILMLAAAKGTRLTISATGRQAAEVIAALSSLVEDGFGENG